MTVEKPFLSVIIPTYHDWGRLQLCLNALNKQTYPKDWFEIIVVNNDPKDKAPTSLSLPKNCQLLEEYQPGSYAARNKALAVAKGEILAFTDSDCQPRDDWLDVAVDFFTLNSEYDRIGGEIELFSENKKWNWFEIYESFFAFPQEIFVEESGMAATGNMFSKKNVFEDVGNFNSSLMSGGDGEWGKRAYRKGYKIKYLANCVVFHPTRSDHNAILSKNKRLVGGKLKIERKKGRLAVFKLLFKSLMPPFTAFKRALNKKDESVSKKLVAMLICYYIKLCGTFELFMLVFLNKKIERR